MRVQPFNGEVALLYNSMTSTSDERLKTSLVIAKLGEEET
jgi:hypothetical protein